MNNIELSLNRDQQAEWPEGRAATTAYPEREPLADGRAPLLPARARQRLQGAIHIRRLRDFKTLPF